MKYKRIYDVCQKAASWIAPIPFFCYLPHVVCTNHCNPVFLSCASGFMILIKPITAVVTMLVCNLWAKSKGEQPPFAKSDFI